MNTFKTFRLMAILGAAFLVARAIFYFMGLNVSAIYYIFLLGIVFLALGLIGMGVSKAKS